MISIIQNLYSGAWTCNREPRLERFGSPLMAESFQACFFELRLIEIEADLIACHACLDMIQFANKSDLDFKEVNANYNFLGAKDPGFCFLEIFCIKITKCSWFWWKSLWIRILLTCHFTFYCGFLEHWNRQESLTSICYYLSMTVFVDFENYS